MLSAGEFHRETQVDTALDRQVRKDIQDMAQNIRLQTDLMSVVGKQHKCYEP